MESGYTTGGPEFDIDEDDDNYIVNIQVIGYAGSAPAAGSQDIVGYVTATNGFTATVGADPGGTSVITFGYQIVRTPYKPYYFEFLPATPSSFANPLLDIVPTGTPFAIGVTLVPVTGNCFTWYTANAYETAFSEGTAAGNADWFELDKQGNWLVIEAREAGISTGIVDPRVVNNRLCTPLNPGPHQLRRHQPQRQPEAVPGRPAGQFGAPRPPMGRPEREPLPWPASGCLAAVDDCDAEEPEN